MRLSGAASVWLVACGACVISVAACRKPDPTNRVNASGYVEVTEVRVAPEVGGRVVEMMVAEGSRVVAGAVIARLDSEQASLALDRAKAERDQTSAQLRLAQAGPLKEEIQQASAQVDRARAEVVAAEAELASATLDLERFERLLERNAGSRKQRDDAATRREVASARVGAARENEVAARAALARLRLGARPQELDAAKARVAAAEAQIAMLEKTIADATVTVQLPGTVTQKLVDAGEVVAPRAPLVVVSDLEHVWANVFVAEPVVPRLRLGQQAMLHTDAGGAPLPGTISFISPKAEFTPRNVQTAEERSKLVYRVKITADNPQGVLKQGMPVEAEIPLN